MITSTTNPRVQWIRSLQRKRRAREEEGAFVIEGLRLAQEALTAAVVPRFVLHTNDIGERGRKLIEGFAESGAPTLLVSENVLRACAATETPQGLVAVVPFPNPPLPDRYTLALIADGLADPGNLGAVLRTALAAGVEAVFLTSGTVDAYNPKVVRAAMGAHFHLPIVTESPGSIRRRLQDLAIWVADPHRGRPVYQLDARQPVALVVGGEARGPADAWRSDDIVVVTIPTVPEAESLNTAAAAAVLLFEIRRQRGLP